MCVFRHFHGTQGSVLNMLATEMEQRARKGRSTHVQVIPPQRCVEGCRCVSVPVPHFLSLWTQTLASSFPGRSQASSLDWGSSLALPCSKAPSFSAWAAAGSPYFPACRQSLWIRITSAVVSQLTTFPICKLTYILLGFLLLRTPACVCGGGGEVMNKKRPKLEFPSKALRLWISPWKQVWPLCVFSGNWNLR